MNTNPPLRFVKNTVDPEVADFVHVHDGGRSLDDDLLQPRSPYHAHPSRDEPCIPAGESKTRKQATVSIVLFLETQ